MLMLNEASIACMISETGRLNSIKVVIGRRYLRMWRKNFL